jgi:hypothetical protein
VARFGERRAAAGGIGNVGFGFAVPDEIELHDSKL